MSTATHDTQNITLSPAPGSDLRHMTSQPTLLPPSQMASSPSRPAQPLSSLSPNSSRPGSRSPASIPSSPTSIHSSSSAIFERDIETLPTASPPPHPLTHHTPNPHRTPRSKATEQIEQSVPSVLDEAASALAGNGDNDIAVIAPAPIPFSFSQAGSVGSSPPLRSRSPSPSPQSRKASLPVPSASASASTSGSPGRPTIGTRASTGPMPPGAFGVSPATPTTISASGPSPVPSPTTATSSLPPSIPAPDSTTSVHSTSAQQKRLSFVSYSDLLSSTPITSLPLSSLTSPHSAAPPPHLPAVSAAATSSPPPSSAQSQGAPSRPLSTYSISTSAGGALSMTGGMSGTGGRGGGLGEEQQGVGKRLKDDIGGEWEREGFGKGLEERLEELMVGKA